MIHKLNTDARKRCFSSPVHLLSNEKTAILIYSGQFEQSKMVILKTPSNHSVQEIGE